MLQPWLNALTQDVLGAMVCLEAMAAIGLVVTWGRDSYVRSESPLIASTLEFGRSVAHASRSLALRPGRWAQVSYAACARLPANSSCSRAARSPRNSVRRLMPHHLSKASSPVPSPRHNRS
jgi:hypothetical protein